ncbi:MAG: hypothetical protein H7A27_07575 [Spirochaetaceae bacterium]|nr:hypothetical protein [Spirochaetaceae bacterium]
MAISANRSLKASLPFQLAAFTGAFAALTVLAASILAVRSFSSIERSGLEDRVEQFGALLGRERDAIANLAKSYAEWGDSYSFMATRDPDYLRNNYGADWIYGRRRSTRSRSSPTTGRYSGRASTCPGRLALGRSPPAVQG